MEIQGVELVFFFLLDIRGTERQTQMDSQKERRGGNGGGGCKDCPKHFFYSSGRCQLRGRSANSWFDHTRLITAKCLYFCTLNLQYANKYGIGSGG